MFGDGFSGMYGRSRRASFQRSRSATVTFIVKQPASCAGGGSLEPDENPVSVGRQSPFAAGSLEAQFPQPRSHLIPHHHAERLLGGRHAALDRCYFISSAQNSPNASM